jgi:hypothetical protein
LFEYEALINRLQITSFPDTGAEDRAQALSRYHGAVISSNRTAWMAQLLLAILIAAVLTPRPTAAARLPDTVLYDPLRDAPAEATQPQTHQRFRLLPAHPGEYGPSSSTYDQSSQNSLQPDPLGPIDSTNLYQAFNYDPFNFTDPPGLSIWGSFKDYYADYRAHERAKLRASIQEVLEGDAMEQAAVTFAGRPVNFAVGWWKAIGEAVYGGGVLAHDVVAGGIAPGYAARSGSYERQAAVGNAIGGFLTDPFGTTGRHFGGRIREIIALERAGDWAGASQIAGSTAFEGYAAFHGGAAVFRMGRAAVRTSWRSATLAPRDAVARSPVNRGVGSGGPLGWVADSYRGLRLRQIHRQVVGEVDAAIRAGDRSALRGLGASRRQAYRALRPRSRARFRGTIIDQAVKARAARTFGLKGLRAPGGFEYGADFWNPRTLRAWDMTTPGQWAAHVHQYITSPAAGRPAWRVLYPLLH